MTPSTDGSGGWRSLLDRRDLLFLGMIIAASWFIQTWFLNYTVDDAFITFRFSRNLAQGLGPVFNPGERVEGCTNFLWMVWCALPFIAHVDVLWFSKLSLMLLSGANLVLVVLLARRVLPGAGRVLTLLPAVALATHVSFVTYSVNGIETQLFVCLLLIALLAAAREFEFGGYASAFAFGALFLTRPDGFLFFGLAWLARLVAGRRGRSFVAWSLIVAAFAAGLTLFRLAYFGDIVPNTFYAKGAGAPLTRISYVSVRYFQDVFEFLPNWLYLVLPLAGLVFWRRLGRFTRFLVFVPFIYLAYVLYIGGDHNFPYFRFVLHVLPVLAVTAFLPFIELWPGPGSRPGRRATVAAAVSLVVVLSVLQLAYLRRVWNSFNRTAESPTFTYLATLPPCGAVSIYPDIAQVLKFTCPPGTSVVMQDVGAIPYYSGVNTIDIIGLCDKTLAREYYRQKYSDYLRGRIAVPVLLEVDQFVRDYIIDRRRAEYVLYHVDTDRGEPDDLAQSYHWHFLYFDERFDSLYRRIAEFRYPNTDRLDHILFERIRR